MNHCFSYEQIEDYNDDDNNDDDNNDNDDNDDDDNDNDNNMTCTGGMNIVYNYDGRHSRCCRPRGLGVPLKKLGG
jgi:hypothetical protein